MKHTVQAMPNLAFLKSQLTYDPETGIFMWRVRGSGRRIGAQIGSVSPRGYRSIYMGHQMYRAHRLAYFYMTEQDPMEMVVDHINGVVDDNRFVNLRLATISQNRMNSKVAQSKSGFTNVRQNRSGTWRAIAPQLNGKRRALGSYPTRDEAVRAADAAKLKVCGEFHYVLDTSVFS